MFLSFIYAIKAWELIAVLTVELSTEYEHLKIIGGTERQVVKF